MLYTASYFVPTHHHGLLLSVSNKIPKGFRVDGRLQFFAPSDQLLADWKAKLIDEDAYIERYRAQTKHNWKDIKLWLDSLDPKQDATILCYERQGFCHRNLIGKIIQHYRPDCWRGADVACIKLEQCKHCGNEICPGLDFDYCFNCKIWVKQKSVCNQTI